MNAVCKETWKDIPGYEGKYQASDQGRIRSVDRQVQGRNWHSGHSFTRNLRGRVLRPGKFCKTGHLSVVLGRGTAGKPVHQLVMLAFVGPCPPGHEVCHANGDPGDNRLINLRYDTRTNNILDVFRQGKAWRRLTVDQVLEIRARLAQGERGSDIARDFGVSQTTVSRIKKGKSFAWL